MSDIRRQRGSGRPSNDDINARGLLRTSPKCKICQSPHKDEITKLILEGSLNGEEIRRRFNELDHFKNNPLNPTNINSHKKVVNPHKTQLITSKTNHYHEVTWLLLGYKVINLSPIIISANPEKEK